MAVEVFKAFGVAAKNGTVSEKRIREIMMDNARELSLRQPFETACRQMTLNY